MNGAKLIKISEISNFDDSVGDIDDDEQYDHISETSFKKKKTQLSYFRYQTNKSKGTSVDLEVSSINKKFIQRYPTKKFPEKNDCLLKGEADSPFIMNHNEENNTINLVYPQDFDKEKSPLHRLAQPYQIHQDFILQEAEMIRFDNNPEEDKYRLSYTLPKREGQKRIFEEFLTIGIEDTGLEYIEDMDELYMTPKIISNYPNNLLENELEYNIKFLKNFCFNEGVKVKRCYVSNDDDYIQQILEQNFFSKFKLSFCLVQQISPDALQKYFIFGVRFDDLYITNSRQRPLSKNIFVYEKTFLFISCEPLCTLFENILQYFLNIKKLNFFQLLDSYESLLIEENIRQFYNGNKEKTSEGIIEVLHYFFERSYPRFDEYIGYKSPINDLILNYKHPNQNNERFLATEYLSKILFKLINTESFYQILLRILLEQSFLFISDNIQYLTALVLGFSYLIQPFAWPFIIIPNLPLDLLNMIESPVPYLIGILGDSTMTSSFLNNNNIFANLIYLNPEGKMDFIIREKMTCKEPYLGNLEQILYQNLKMAQYYHSIKMHDDYENYCEKIYKNLHGILKSEIADIIEKLLKSETALSEFTSHHTLEMSNITFGNNLRYNDSILLTKNGCANDNTYQINELIDTANAKLKEKFISALDEKNIQFGSQFAQTQIFISCIEELRRKEMEDDVDI